MTSPASGIERAPVLHFRPRHPETLDPLIQSLIYTDGDERAEVAIAFTSLSAQHDVRTVVHAFGARLANVSEKRTLIVERPGRQDLCPADVNQLLSRVRSEREPNLFTLPSISRAATFSDAEVRDDCLDLLKARFPYILLDCQPVDVSFEAAALAPIVQGVVFVMPAGSDYDARIDRAARLISHANGTVLGIIEQHESGRRFPFFRRLMEG